MDTIKNENKLLTKEEVCVYLSISSPTLERWLKQQKIPVIRFGRTVRFSIDAIKELIPKNTTID
jgi:excisionase family DNA binding protein